MTHTIETTEGSDTYIELTGWLDGSNGVTLLHEYELDWSGESTSIKLNSRYRLLDLESGETSDLQIEPALTGLIASDPVRASRPNSIGADMRIYWIDSKKRLLQIALENGSWLSEPGEKRVTWVTNIHGPEKSVYHEFDSNTGQIRKKELDYDIRDIHTVGREWIVWGDMQYTRVE